MLIAADDGVHHRPHDASDAWQENCFLLAHDEARDVCVYLHVERLQDRVEVQAALDVGGRTTWHAADDDWWYEVDAPFERSRWSWQGGPLRLDLELRSHLPAIDHAAALARLGLAGAERDHYEAVGRCTGAIALDGAATAIDALFVRDHTWGVREYQRFGASWWWPTCLDGGDAYAGGVAVDLGDRTVGYGLVADTDGVAVGTDVSVEVVGTPEPAGYSATTVRYTPDGREPVTLRSTTRRHLSTTFPGFGPDRRWNEAYSICSWGDRTGFGTRELGC